METSYLTHTKIIASAKSCSAAHIENPFTRATPSLLIKSQQIRYLISTLEGPQKKSDTVKQHQQAIHTFIW